MKIALIGCGLIGKKRVENLISGMELVGCYDVNEELNSHFSFEYSIRKYNNVREICVDSEIDTVFVATSHVYLFEIANELLMSDKNVFIEKPGAIRSVDLETLKILANVKNKVIHIGYNHRFHPAILKAKELIDANEIGEILYIRSNYGHGGRIGYEKEWRANQLISGGGELIDQGTHLINLALMFLGDLKLEYAATPTYFWNMSVEDNAFMALISEKMQIAFMHASCTEWKNKFNFEIYGSKGKLEINGLGRSYGVEQICYYRMLPEMGPPIKEEWIFDSPDISWQREIEDFYKKCKSGENFDENIAHSVRTLQLIEDIYRRTGR